MDQPMSYRGELDYSRRRLSTSSEERTIFYIDDMSPPADSSPTSDQGLRCGAEPTAGMRPRSSQPPRHQQRRRKSSASSQTGGGGGGGTGRPRRQRRPSEFGEQHQARRSSSSGRPRANSCARPTPLGDGRRASVCKAKAVKGGPRRASSAHRRDSVRPARSDGTRSPSVLLTPTSLEAAVDTIKDPREMERARRHRRVAMLLLGTFLFILAASVLAVVVTLTHSSFHRPPTGSRELAEHRANSARRTRSC